MNEPKVSLFEMAEAVGAEATDARDRVERWDRAHPDHPLTPADRWFKEARAFETAHLTLGLMSLDESASRKFVSSIIASKPSEAKMMMTMLGWAA